MQRMQRRAAQMMTTRLLHPRQMMRRHLRRRKPLLAQDGFNQKVRLCCLALSAHPASGRSLPLRSHLGGAALGHFNDCICPGALPEGQVHRAPVTFSSVLRAGILKCLLCTKIPVTGIILSRNLTWSCTSNLFFSTFSATDSSAIGAESHLRIRASSCTFNGKIDGQGAFRRKTMLKLQPWQMKPTCLWSSCWPCMAWSLTRTKLNHQTALPTAPQRTLQEAGAAAPPNAES